MLFKTALKNLKRNPVMNIICLIQLTAVFLIAAVMVSTMSVRYQTYAPLKKYLSDRGLFVFYNSICFGAIKPNGNMNTDAIFSMEELREYMNAEKQSLFGRIMRLQLTLSILLTRSFTRTNC